MTRSREDVGMAEGAARPFRAELLSAERLAERARLLATVQHWSCKRLPYPTPLIALVQRAAEELDADNVVLATAVREQQPISPGAEWLLDNYYLVEEQVRAVKDDLPAGYGAELPWLTTGAHEGMPRVYEAVVTLVEHTDARIDEDYLLRFVDGFQDAEPLTMGEVWAIPIMLRIALIENTRRLSGAVVRSHGASRLADVWADRLLLAAQEDSAALRPLIDELDRSVPTQSPVFYIRLSQRLQGQEHGADAINAWMERRLVEAGISLDEQTQFEQQRQAADQISIANTITSIRFLDAYDWKSFFETVSVVEQVLRQDPAGVYARMDFRSRDRYRHALESLARRCPHDEIEVAEAVVSWALESLDADPADMVSGHVGHYLISKGRYALESSLGYRPHGRERLYRGPLSRRGLYYWGLLVAFTLLFSAAIGGYGLAVGAEWWEVLVLVILSLVPMSDLAVSVTNRISSWLYPPRMLPKLDYREPLAGAHRTLVVIPSLLTSVNAVRSVLDNLEVAYLANRDDNLGFALLGDLKGASQQHMEADADIVEAAQHGVAALNERYLAEHGRLPFHLYIRGRTYSEAEGTWMGWERKRGSLVELNRLIRGTTETSFAHRMGDEGFLRDVTFVLTLDTDTVLPRDGARKLVSTIAHPLNRARLEPGDERVKTGYGLVQPRVGMSLPASSRSYFARLYSGLTGIDPYSGAVSDTYQDVFGEGSFTGKGIYEVNVFNAVLEGKFPEGALLSHDLIEGNYLRTALASDIEVLDDYPSSYLSHCSRLHRWVRGDWQTLPWLGHRVPVEDGSQPNPLSALHRWKMIDNLRRSLVAPFTVLLITIGWLLLPGLAWAWPLFMLLVILFPVYFHLADSLIFRSGEISFSIASGAIVSDLKRETVRAALDLAMLPHQAYLMVDAVVRSLWRILVSRKNLLEWETAADIERRLAGTLQGFARRMWPSSAIGVALMLLGSLAEPLRLLIAAPLMLLWAAAPVIAWQVSRPEEVERAALAENERVMLRRLARRTWRFFETFVTPQTHWLAPDNFQEEPVGTVAYRTSPTNVGLQLLSYLSAFDLGYVTVEGVVTRTSDTLNTMAGLERFRGHFYNWYDILTLKPLPPNYVSTVDSGNLAGHLLVLRIGLLEISQGPILGEQLLQGVADTAMVIEEDVAGVTAEVPGDGESLQSLRQELGEIVRDVELEEPPRDLGTWHAVLERLSARANAVQGYAESMVSALAVEEPLGVEWTEFPVSPSERLRRSVKELYDLVEDARSALRRLAPWAALIEQVPGTVLADHRAEALQPIISSVPSLTGLAEDLTQVRSALASLQVDPPGGTQAEREQAVRWAEELLSSMEDSRSEAVMLLARLRLDADIAREMWEHTDFTMLFDSHRLLFSIGYNTAEGRLDPSYYDMLASECRLASFVAVAKGDVPQEHWFRLGRSLTSTGQGRALLSWSASMFEYLMPLLVMKNWPRTLLDETYGNVVLRQVEYARERGVPWGISESAFNAKDAQLTYQYQAFGIPGLGLKRGLSDDVVVAPYATILALPVARELVLENIHALSERGVRGRYGFYESIDYTPGRVPAGESRAIVKAYFAHHQGMSLVALGNELTDYRMHDRFHEDPMVASAELLLQERVPRGVELAHPHVEEVRHVTSIRELPPPTARSYPLADTPVPATHFLSNGSYSVMVTNGGGGYSRWRGLAVTRYREDVTRDSWGQFFYLRDEDSGEVWNAAHNPCPKKPDEYHVTFSADKAEFRRHDGDIETSMEVSVSPEDDIEVRRVTVTNRGREPRRISVTSYFEIALTRQEADQSHKSFSNLFVETAVVQQNNAVLFSRRPRSDEEERVWGFHVLGCEMAERCDWSYETDRAKFLGRYRQSDDPSAMEAGAPLSGTIGAVLDPCCAIRHGVEIPAGGSARWVFATGVAEERAEALRLSEKYKDPRSAQRAIDLAWTASQIELRNMGISGPEAVVLQRLASRLLLTDPYSRLKVKTPVENGLPISGLWSLGISGDYPILLVRIEDMEHTPLVRQALLAHQYWRHKGLVADLVILNTRPTTYADELDERLKLLVRTGHALQLIDKPGGVFLRRADQMHPDVLNLLLSVARATLEGDGGSIELQLNQRAIRPDDPPALVPHAQPPAYPQPEFERPPALLFDNGLGGFDAGSDEYVIVLEDKAATPAPWVNVMGMPRFGGMVSEAGVGCTWAINSHENRITTWNNDPVSDGSGEAFFIRDEDTGEFWSPTPLPKRDNEPYVVRHGKGYSRFEHTSHGIEQRLDWFVSATEPVRVVRVTVRNVTDRPRRLTLTQFVEWVLGPSRSKAQQLVVTWYDAEHEILTAHNHFNPDFPGRSAFVAADRPLHSFTGSRTEFVGRNGRPSDPAAMHRQRLDGRTGRYLDNCGALMVEIRLEPGEEKVTSFFLGQTSALDEARDVVERLRTPGAIEGSLETVRGFWDEILGAVQVRSPDPALDALVNGQLLYQAVSCRMWGRTATYQSSGAFGFRDQLQDSLCTIFSRPDLMREQIIEASRHQFPEGDVLHWWQPVSGRGVRTLITDDRHWLPYLVSTYVEATGDLGVLDERTALIEGPPVEPGREDNYMQPSVSETAITVYEHCIRALESGRGRGPHDLPLMGGGDWNDGMNRVGIEGRGESVWLAWFLNVVLTRFAPICELKGDAELAEDYRSWAQSLADAADANAWDGSWYRRAYFDDGTPLGTREAEECRIDAIAQAWATISGAGDSRRAAVALDSLEEKLVRREDKLIALLTPPFDHMTHDPGYIKGYVPGVRENGGQYTHAALWTVLAYLMRGDGDQALGLLDLINPVNHALTASDVGVYKVEPYVVAADVYAVPPHVGRGGWTWYTGSASWFYHVTVEHAFGLRLIANETGRFFTVDPCIPKSWQEYELAYRYGSSLYEVRVKNPRGVNRGVAHLELDGEPRHDLLVPLVDDGAVHQVDVTLLGG